MTFSEIYLPSPEDTRRVGLEMGRRILAELRRGSLTLPFLVTLSGELGAGKTSLCQGLGEGLGADPAEIVSPTFTLANEYQGMVEIYHLDLYRLDGRDEFFEAGLDEYLRRPGLTWVEWPEKMAGFWPEKRLELSLSIEKEGRLLKAGGGFTVH